MANTPPPSRLNPLQQATARWAPRFGLLIMAAIAAGYLDHVHAIPGMLAGTVVVLWGAAGALVCLYAARRAGLEPARFPLEAVASSAATQFFILAVVLLFGQIVWRAWWASDAPGHSAWFEKLFFLGRVVAYYLAIVLTVVSFKNKQAAPERLLLFPALAVAASYDLVVSLHAPAPFWLGTLVWVPLLAFGIATAAALASVVLATLARTGAATGDVAPAVAWLRRRALVAAIAALVATAIVAVVLATVDVGAAWRPHADGIWRVWLAAAAVLVIAACALLASDRPLRTLAATIFLVVGFGIVALVAILPATAATAGVGIGLAAVGGFAGGIVGPAFGLIAAINKLADAKR